MNEVIQHSGTKVIEAKSKLANRPSKSKGKYYDKFFVYIPSEVARDSAFPFSDGELVNIRIDPEKKRIIIEKTPTD